MAKPIDTERRLAAIFAADVEGYSRLMGADEVETLEALTQRRAILDGLISERRGRIANTAGDSVLAEFGSAVDAVQCAVEAQAALAEANAGLSLDRHINFRIGVHVGDVMVRGGDLFGDGVNIAARLQTLASAGGTCISGAAHDQVRKILPFAFADLGAQQVKNIEEPVRAFSVTAKGATAAGFPARSSSPHADNNKPLQLPDKPSIAVLPFTNMSGDPEQEYFADGMVEDIITALSQFKSLFVIARNSSFTYKGKAVDIKQVGHELGVRYVLEGSVRKSGNRIRINGQLIEAATGAHIWAEKIDGALEDVFELQDEVTSRVAGAIEPSIKLAEIGRANTKPTTNLDAYDLFLRALAKYYQFTREDNDIVVGHLRAAIKLDPAYALAKAFLSFNHVTRWNQGWGEPGDREKGPALAREAIADDSNDPAVLRWAGHTLGFWEEHDRALAVLEKAARLNVNGSQVLSSLGWVMNYACIDPDRAISSFERAMRLSPRDHELALMWSGIANAHLIAGRDEAALSAAQRGLDEAPRFVSAHRNKIAALVHLGRLAEATAATGEFLKLDPGFTISTRVPKYRDLAFRQKYHAALQAVGLPE